MRVRDRQCLNFVHLSCNGRIAGSQWDIIFTALKVLVLEYWVCCQACFADEWFVRQKSLTSLSFYNHRAVTSDILSHGCVWQTAQQLSLTCSSGDSCRCRAVVVRILLHSCWCFSAVTVCVCVDSRVMNWTDSGTAESASMSSVSHEPLVNVWFTAGSVHHSFISICLSPLLPCTVVTYLLWICWSLCYQLTRCQEPHVL